MRATAKAHPNIALIKYWGKRDTARNLPAVGSISITLSELATSMRVEFNDALPHDRLVVNGSESPSLLPRVSRCLDTVAGADRACASVASDSNFPIAAGLASSAAAFAALVVAADAAIGQHGGTLQLARLAGAASGSAARSLYGGFVELASDDDEITLTRLCGEDEWPLAVVVAITASGPKPTGSTPAMETSRRTSPFFDRWVEQQHLDLDAARTAIAARDFVALATVAEHNCLKMHSVMWASRPPMVYWNAATIDCMQAVRELQSAGHAVFFTIDAGPQLKAVCEPADAQRVADSLRGVAGVEKVIVAGLGGAARVTAA